MKGKKSLQDKVPLERESSEGEETESECEAGKQCINENNQIYYDILILNHHGNII